jgi:tRNA pseudouridine13 synthase
MKIAYKYWTKSKGAGGRIWQPEDFVVNEVVDRKFLRSFERTGKGVRRVAGPYSLFLLKKKNMTTHRAIKIISQKLGIPANGLGYAGLKDRFAVTTQYVTIKGAKTDGFEAGDLSLVKVGVTNRHVSVGDLEGNEFKITLHGCKAARLSPVVKELSKGIPNYFGPQRFGAAGNNHVIGKLLVKRRFDKALGEINRIYGKNYPSLSAVNKKALKFFINAYQSWIFNEALNRYMEKNNAPLFAEIPIAGFGTRLKNGPAGKILKTILAGEKIKPQDFQIRELNMACRGGVRHAFIKVGVKFYAMQDGSVTLRFALPKGCYATNVIREICKNEK